jgi:hypothetical protein
VSTSILSVEKHVLLCSHYQIDLLRRIQKKCTSIAAIADSDDTLLANVNVIRLMAREAKITLPSHLIPVDGDPSSTPSSQLTF